ncbi:T9SS type A sorting domain-containing protein, partial [Fulvivirga kasyanovii]
TDTTGKLTESGIASATPVSNQSARINSTSTANAFGDTPEAPSLLESENIGWSVFPNPVKNTLEIKGEFSGNWILYDMQNREVMSGNQTSLQMEDMKQGMYILKIEGKAIRIIKE